ncbi:MAG: 4-hydroxyproline epimerase [Bacteroidota bacterium]
MSKRFFCIDAHTCGNPVRVVAGGGPILQSHTMSQKRLEFLAHHDWIRRGLMFEPRGHDMMSGSIIYPPADPQHDAGILFIETSGCLPMCGHGTIGTVTVAIEEGLITPREPGKLQLETPAGLIDIAYEQEGKKVRAVSLTNVPAFLYKEALSVECPDLGQLKVDVAYGGNFYAIVDPQSNYLGLEHYTASDLIRWSPIIRQRLNAAYSFHHPTDDAIQGLSHVLWTGTPQHSNATARNAVFYGDKAIDRSPCGTGTSARMAQWAAKGKLKVGDRFVHESIIGSLFEGKVVASTTCGDFPAIIPQVTGWAKITGFNTILIDAEDDPFAYGFQVK